MVYLAFGETRYSFGATPTDWLYTGQYEAVAWQVSIFIMHAGITIEGQELEIAFNVKFLQDGLETITTKNVIIEANAHNTPAVLHSAGEEESLYILMPMHIDGK